MTKTQEDWKAELVNGVIRRSYYALSSIDKEDAFQEGYLTVLKIEQAADIERRGYIIIAVRRRVGRMLRKLYNDAGRSILKTGEDVAYLATSDDGGKRDTFRKRREQCTHYYSRQ